MAKADHCIFCDTALDASNLQLSSSRTKEHVFARWFRDAVANNKIKMFNGGVGMAPTLVRQPSLNAFVNTNVCGKCNSGWMSTLETEVAPIVDRLVADDCIEELSQSEIETLARWTGKTAIVLSYVTPTPEIVPKHMRAVLHPDSKVPPMLKFFYSRIKADFTLEGAFLQLTYGDEIGLIGTTDLPGTRITLCVYNHMLTVDFPPIMQGIDYDLSKSTSAMFWPYRKPAGTMTLETKLPAPIGDVLYEICSSIQPVFQIAYLR